MDTISYILFACDIISGLVFVIYSLYVFFRIFKQTAIEIKRRMTKIGSKILSNKIYSNLKLTINSHNDQQQTLAPPAVLSPTSLHFDKFDGTNDPPTSAERIMSTDRPFSPLLKIPIPEFSRREEDIGTERKGNSFTELPVFSPSNMTGADMLSFGLSPERGQSIPVSFKGNESPPEEEPNSQDLSEILQNEFANSPSISVDNRTSKVLEFKKDNWNDALSKKKSKKFNN